MSDKPEQNLDSDIFQPETDLAFCLLPLLDSLGWRGSQSQLIEALPHQPNDLSLSDMLNVLASLKFASKSMFTTLNKIDHRLLPCLFVPDTDSAKVLVKGAGAEFLAFDGGTGEFSQVEKGRGSGQVFFSRQSKLNNPHY